MTDLLSRDERNQFKKWRRNQLVGSPTEEPANKGAEMGTVPDQLTDAQIEAGVAALRQIRSKFKGDQTDQATVYAVFFAVLGTTS